MRVNGQPQIRIQGDISGKECLMIDDLADGGRTFIALAHELRAQGATKVFLYVTHGQFNHGLDELQTAIDRVFCTNSYRDIHLEFVTQYKVI